MDILGANLPTRPSKYKWSLLILKSNSPSYLPYSNFPHIQISNRYLTLICYRHCSKYFAYIDSLNLHYNPMRSVLSLSPFYRGGFSDIESCIALKLIDGRARYGEKMPCVCCLIFLPVQQEEFTSNYHCIKVGPYDWFWTIESDEGHLPSLAPPICSMVFYTHSLCLSGSKWPQDERSLDLWITTCKRERLEVLLTHTGQWHEG